MEPIFSLMTNFLSFRTAAVLPFIPLILYHFINIKIERAQLATRTSWDTHYDYIVIGSGSGGAVMASRLSEDPSIKVLLLEAGGPEKAFSQISIYAFFLQKTNMDWNFVTEPQQHSCFGLKNRQSAWPRGKSIGGSTAINVMLYVRGNSRDYDHWAKQGATGWSWSQVFPYFIKAENNMDSNSVASGYHGIGGPLSVTRFDYPTKAARAFQAAGPYLGYPSGNFNGQTQSTFTIPQRTIYNGEQFSVAKAYLEPIYQKRSNLHILANSFVTRILFDDNKRAIGVEFDRNSHRNNVVYVNREVILSAGAIMSPKILLLSGIGPREQLNQFGIPVIADLPVGENLQEHYASGVLFTLEKESSLDMTRDFSLEQLYSYVTKKDSLFASNILEGIAFIKTKFVNETDDFPDIEMHMVPGE